MKFKEIVNSLRQSRAISTNIGKRAVSTGNIIPGDIMIFSYDSYKPGGWSTHYRLVLIISTKHGSGFYRARTGNLLLTGYELNSVGPESLDVLLSNLFKKRTIANYTKISRALDRFLGEASYKTYNFSRIRDMYEVNIK